MSERNKLIIAIIAVISIIIVVVGATYAYWQWNTNTNEKTNMIFTVPTQDSQLSASLEGGETTTVANLLPAACTNTTYAMKKEMTLTYKNLTTQTASIKATLTVNDWTQPHSGTPMLGKMHYALTMGSMAGEDCAAGTNRVLVTGGVRSTFVSSGNLIDNVEILSVAPNTDETTETYYLWVWVDSSYEGTNTGNTISDPLQDLTFTLTWTGTITNG
mgnify:CR=1 FL=1